MHGTRVALASLLLIVISGCAYQGDLEAVRRDTDEMKSRLFTMDKGLNELRGEVKEGAEKSANGYRQSIAELQKEVAALRKGGADLQASLDSARVDMQLLSGKVDDVRVQAQKPADDLELLKQDLTQRLSSLDERLGKLEKKAAEQQQKAAQLEQTPEFLYQQGLDALKGEDFPKARALFTKFLELHPKHPLAANARYWVGESYYSEKNYEQAILEFQEVIKNFPDKEKAPAAMLKQGMAFSQLGDRKSASFVYRKLTEEYPKSEEAKLAKEKLKGK